MADEPDVQAPAEITPDDFMADEQESTKTESSPVETKEPEAEAEVTKDVEAQPDTPEETEAKETEGEPEQSEVPEETDKPTKADERKAQLNQEIRDLVSQRNAIKAEVTKATGEVYQPATENDLVDEGMSVTEAKVEAMRQQLEVRDYNERVAEAQLTLGSESLRVMNDFPIFNPDSDQFDQELAEEAASLLESNLIRDPNVPEIDPETGKPTGNGLIIGSNVSPYKFYKTLARASGISATKGQLKGQQAHQEMLANADSPGSVAPPKKTVDPVVAIWTADD
jgi:hypothetical protein